MFERFDVYYVLFRRHYNTAGYPCSYYTTPATRSRYHFPRAGDNGDGSRDPAWSPLCTSSDTWRVWECRWREGTGKNKIKKKYSGGKNDEKNIKNPGNAVFIVTACGKPVYTPVEPSSVARRIHYHGTATPELLTIGGGDDDVRRPTRGFCGGFPRGRAVGACVRVPPPRPPPVVRHRHGGPTARGVVGIAGRHDRTPRKCRAIASARWIIHRRPSVVVTVAVRVWPLGKSSSSCVGSEIGRPKCRNNYERQSDDRVRGLGRADYRRRVRSWPGQVNQRIFNSAVSIVDEYSTSWRKLNQPGVWFSSVFSSIVVLS